MPDIQLLHMNCMDFMADCEANAFELAIVDPEYGRKEHGGINRTHWVKQRNGTKKLCKDGGYAKKEWDHTPPDSSYFAELFRVSVHQIIWGMNYHPIILTGGAIVWDKVNDGADQSSCEIASCSLTTRVDIVRYMWRGMMQGESILNGTRQQGNKRLNEKRIHPTQKPVKLYEWLLANYAKEGDRILDTHLGSASSAIAAQYSGYDFVGMEIDEDYYNAAVNRFNQETKQLDLLGVENA